jgi:hypothetical protein
MDCTTLQAIFSGARQDDLSDAEAAAFEQHLRACDPCREKLAEAEEQLAPLVDSMEPPAVPDAAWDRVTRAVKAEAARPVLTVHAGGGASKAPRWIAIAAAFLLAAGLGALMPLDWIPGRDSRVVSNIPSSVEDVRPPAPPSVGTPQARVAVVTAQGGERFLADHMHFDCADEQVLLISVRDKDL